MKGSVEYVKQPGEKKANPDNLSYSMYFASLNTYF